MGTDVLLTAEYLLDMSMAKGLSGKGKPPAFRFARLADIKDTDKCIEWMGTKDKLGYGRLSMFLPNGKYQPILAHRISLALSGIPVPHNMCVMHKCDNPSCVNPRHLSLGSKHENNSDMRVKKRSARGQKNGKAKLSDDEAIEIYKSLLNGEQGRRLARKYGVSEMTVSSIKHGRRWIYIKEMVGDQ